MVWYVAERVEQYVIIAQDGKVLGSSDVKYGGGCRA